MSRIKNLRNLWLLLIFNQIFEILIQLITVELLEVYIICQTLQTQNTIHVKSLI